MDAKTWRIGNLKEKPRPIDSDKCLSARLGGFSSRSGCYSLPTNHNHCQYADDYKRPFGVVQKQLPETHGFHVHCQPIIHRGVLSPAAQPHQISWKGPRWAEDVQPDPAHDSRSIMDSLGVSPFQPLRTL